MLVPAADWPVAGALVSAVSLAVPAPFSLLPDPWCEAAEPAEFCVSILVPAADWPVTGALVSAVSLAVATFSPLHRQSCGEGAEGEVCGVTVVGAARGGVAGRVLRLGVVAGRRLASHRRVGLRRLVGGASAVLAVARPLVRGGRAGRVLRLDIGAGRRLAGHRRVGLRRLVGGGDVLAVARPLVGGGRAGRVL